MVSSIITLYNIATALNAKKKIAVKDATYAIAKRKPEIIQVWWYFQTLASAILVQCSIQLG